MTTQLIKQTDGGAPMLPSIVRNADDLVKLGALFEQSSMFGCKQQGQGTVLVLNCLMSNMTPFEFIETYHLVDGKPSMRADAMLARLLECGGTYKIIARDAERAAIEATFKDATGTFTFSWSEAKAERFPYMKDGKTLKDNWSTARGRMQMLWARVVSDAVRTVCPLACRGTYTPEEAADFADTEPKRVEAEPVRVAAADAAKLVPVGDTPKTDTKPALQVLDPQVLPPEAKAPEAAGEPVDFTVMPVGKFKGKAWAELNDTQLAQVLGLKNPAITDGHRAAVTAEIERRKGGAS